MSLTDLDDAFEAVPGGATKGGPRLAVTREQFLALPARHVPCGYFTLTLTDGSRKRFRVRIERGSFVPGHRTLSISRETDGPAAPHAERAEHEWETLAVLGPAGFNVFKRWRGEWEGRWASSLWDLLSGRPVSGCTVETEPRCWITMRALDAASPASGLCKKWRKEFGL